MKYRIYKYILVCGMVLAASIPAWAQRGPGQGRQRNANQGLCLALTGEAPPTQALSSQEAEALAFLREEEKLSRDVYAGLYAKWGLRTFGNISQREERHMSALKLLLDRYNLPDPAAGNPPGIYRDSGLQTLHNQLLSQGEESLEAALRTGAEIEERSIQHLEKAAAETENSELKLVFGNLRRASENHLQAFVRQLQANGATYAPRHLENEAFAAIAGARQAEGPGRGMGVGYGRGNGRRGPGRGNNGICPRSTL